MLYNYLLVTAVCTLQAGFWSELRSEASAPASIDYRYFLLHSYILTNRRNCRRWVTFVYINFRANKLWLFDLC